MALQHDPALIVLDIMLPKVDGYTAVLRLRGHPPTREIPVIMITGRTEPWFPLLSADMGTVAHLQKPFSPDQLLDAARAALGAERHLIPAQGAPSGRGGMSGPGRATRFDAFQPTAMRAFLQRVCGYALTGDTREQTLIIFSGQGANGKSTFLEAIRKALGDYGRSSAGV